jgi:integral membrane protein (TIGR01906 family)
MDNRLRVIICLILVINLSFIIYLGTAKYFLFNESFYREEFQKNNVYSKVPEASNITKELFVYYKDKDCKEPKIKAFNSRERKHLLDVKILIHKANILFYTLLLVEVLLFLIVARDFGCVNIVLLGGGTLTLMIAVLMFVLSRNFEFIFTSFHYLFFEPGTWLFSAQDTLILMFPKQFFFDIFSGVVKCSLIIAAIILVISLFLIYAKKKHLYF